MNEIRNMVVNLRNSFRVSFIASEAPMPVPPSRIFSLEFSHVPSGAERRSLRRTPSFLSFMSIGTKAMDLSFSATTTKNHGATFW